MGSIQENAEVSACPLRAWAISPIMHPRTDDLIPSAPTSRSHDDVDPSVKVNVIGDFNEASGWEYETSLFEVCVLHEGERCESRIPWKSARWNLIMSPGRHPPSGLIKLDLHTSYPWSSMGTTRRPRVGRSCEHARPELEHR